MNIAVIPARGGSKRIPRKNIREFCGKPIIAYSIEAAIKSKLFERVIVSTDDDEIATVAKSFGAEAPFRRPASLSNDHAATLPVVAHALDWCSNNGCSVESACCIYATAPFISGDYLSQGFTKLRSTPDAEIVFSVTTFAFPIFRALKILENGRVGMFFPENELVRSQDLPDAWHDAGQFYWGTEAAFKRNIGVFSANSYPIILPRYLVQDIDTLEDWERAERMFRVTQNLSILEKSP